MFTHTLRCLAGFIEAGARLNYTFALHIIYSIPNFRILMREAS